MNIGDIAEMAGVSRAAVSRYLNNGYISEEKKERIRKAIEETGYKPSVMAQTLRTKKTRLVGVILPRIHSDSISSIVEGIGTRLNAGGYDMLLATTENDPSRELDFLRIFSNHRVDGVILLATVITKEHRKLLREMKVPVVLVGQSLSGVSCIYHDDLHAGEELTRLMLQSGRKHIGYIGVLKEDVAVGQHRREGYLSAMEAAGLAVTDAMTVTADFSVASGFDRMKQLLFQYPEVDGVIGATDSIALGAMNCLKAAGRRVPEDVAVAGFGDNRIARVTTPTLSTVHFHYKESGGTAAGKMIELMEGRAHATMEIRLGYEVIRRDSIA